MEKNQINKGMCNLCHKYIKIGEISITDYPDDNCESEWIRIHFKCWKRNELL